MRLNNFGFWFLNNCYFWGTNPAKTNALWVGNSAGGVYTATTVPKCTAATPGTGDFVLANVSKAWNTGLPALATPPDNAFFNVKY